MAFVRMEFFVNSTTEPDNYGYFELKLIPDGTNTWEAADVVIDTNGTNGTDTVYWRLWVLDNKSNTTYSPASSFFSYFDDLNCFEGT